MAEMNAPLRLLSMRDLVYISNCIGSGWELLAACLNVSNIQVERIKTSHPRELQMQIYAMLSEWQQSEGCPATLEYLLGTMREVGGVTVDWTKLEKIFGNSVNNDLESGRGTDCTDYGKCVQALQEDLIVHYRKIYSMLPYNPLLEEKATLLLKLYASPTLTRIVRSDDEMVGQSMVKSPVYTYKNVFMSGSKQCNDIYIASEAGYGKTTFAKRMSLAWCYAHQPIKSDEEKFCKDDIETMEEFKLLFFVSLRAAHNFDCDIDVMIENQILKRLAFSHAFTEAFLQRVFLNEKCLVILDGLDEWCHPKSGHCHDIEEKIPHRRARKLCTIITCTRTWKLSDCRLGPNQIDQYLEIGGLQEDSLFKLMQNVIDYLNTSRCKQMNVEDFKIVIDCNNLHELAAIPLILTQLLCLWFDGKPLGQSQCEIYCNMFELLLERYCNREKISLDYCKQSDLHNLVCFNKNPFCRSHQDILSKLGHLAFSTLFNKKQESSMVFDKAYAFRYMSGDLETCLKIGVLTLDEVTSTVSARGENISFLHKTFQEFLAALHIALNLDKGTDIERTILLVCRTIDKVLEMSKTLTFMCGLCSGFVTRLFQSIGQIVFTDSRTKAYRTRSLSRFEPTLRQVQVMLCDLLHEHELNTHGSLSVPLQDYFIDKHTCGYKNGQRTHLKQLLTNNSKNLCSLWINTYMLDVTYLRDLNLASITSECVQKLVLKGLSKGSTARLIRNARHSLKCLEVDKIKLTRSMMTSLSDMHQLESLTLRDITVDHYKMDTLITSMSRCSNLVEIWLRNVNCADCSRYNGEHTVLNVTAFPQLKCLRMAGCVPIIAISPAPRHLELVTFYGVSLTSDRIRSLVYSILELDHSVEVEMGGSTITPDNWDVVDYLESKPGIFITENEIFMYGQRLLHFQTRSDKQISV